MSIRYYRVMIRNLLLAVLPALLACGCSSDVEYSSKGSAGRGNQADCADVSGDWVVATHCDPSLVGTALRVTQTECRLAFSTPFQAFSGTVSADDAISLDGPQSCTGTVSDTAIAMSCTPDTCLVSLNR